MTRWSDFHRPGTVEAVLRALEDHPDSALIAGGTDLLLDLDQGRHPAVNNLIDISGIDELNQLQSVDGFVVIGAAVPLSKVIKNDQVRQNAPGLIEACKLIGGPQVRNVATLGGNVAHALPAGDGTIALLSLDAEAQLVSAGSRNWVSLVNLFSGPGEVAFDRKKAFIAALRIRQRGPSEGSAFRRVMRPQGVAIAIMNMGVWLRCDRAGTILEARVAIGPGGPTPFVARNGSGVLIGRKPDAEVLARVHAAIMAEAHFRTSRHRATQAYREHLVPGLLRQTVLLAYERAFVKDLS